MGQNCFHKLVESLKCCTSAPNASCRPCSAKQRMSLLLPLCCCAMAFQTRTVSKCRWIHRVETARLPFKGNEHEGRVVDGVFMRVALSPVPPTLHHAVQRQGGGWGLCTAWCRTGGTGDRVGGDAHLCYRDAHG